MPGPVWLRLTGLFGLPDDAAEVDRTICAAIGPILRADSDDLVRAPLPEQLSLLLRQIAKGERKLSTAPSRGSARSDVPNLIVEIAGQSNGSATALTITPPRMSVGRSGVAVQRLVKREPSLKLSSSSMATTGTAGGPQ